MGPIPTERFPDKGHAGASRRSIALRWAAVPVAIGLLVLVVLGSRTAALAPVGGGFEASLVLDVLRTVGYVALILGLAGLPVAIVVFRRRKERASDEGQSVFVDLPPPPLWARIAALVLILVVFVAEVVISLTILNDVLRAAAQSTGQAPDLGGQLDAGSLGQVGRESAALLAAMVIVGVLVLVALAFAIKWRLQERRRDAPSRQDPGTVASRAVEVSLAALRAERDPRRAVIAAYAAMERMLAAAGLGRVGSEAPIEYLRRVLAASFGSNAEVATITDLFQVAKFSHHDVDEQMRAAAIDALQAIREHRPESA